MSVLFVAGAGTDVGKTFVTAGLVRRLRAAGRPVVAVKPIASGAPAWDDPAFAASDTAVLLAAQGLPPTRANVDACSPWRYAAPLAPDMAAALEGRTLTLAELVAFHAPLAARAPEGAVLVEGVGGLMSPVASDALGLHWLKALDCPALLVAGSYLGAISHALTARETLRAHGVPCAGMVVSESAASPVDAAQTAAAIARWTGEPVGLLRREA